MGRKICKLCGGRKRIHLDHCDTHRMFDSHCTCDPDNPKGDFGGLPIDAGVPCPDCGGTGERQRHPKPPASA